jgi:hypothetical protein
MESNIITEEQFKKIIQEHIFSIKDLKDLNDFLREGYFKLNGMDASNITSLKIIDWINEKHVLRNEKKSDLLSDKNINDIMIPLLAKAVKKDSRKIFGRQNSSPMDIDTIRKKSQEQFLNQRRIERKKENHQRMQANRGEPNLVTTQPISVKHNNQGLFARYSLPNDAITNAFLGDASILSDIITQQTAQYDDGPSNTFENPTRIIFGQELPLNQINIKVCTLFFSMANGQIICEIKRLPIMHDLFLSLIIIDEKGDVPEYLIEIIAKILAEIETLRLTLPLTVNVDFYRSRSTVQNVFHQDKAPNPVDYLCLQYLNLEPIIIAGPELLILGDNALTPEQRQSIKNDTADTSLKSSTFLMESPMRQLQSFRLLANENTCMFVSDNLCTHATPYLNPGRLGVQPAQIAISHPQVQAVFELARGQNRVEFGRDKIHLSPPPPNRAFLRYWFSTTVARDLEEDVSTNPLLTLKEPGNTLISVPLNPIIIRKKDEYLRLMRSIKNLSVEEFFKSKFNKGGKTKKNKTKKNKTKKNKTKKNKTKKKGGSVTVNNFDTQLLEPTVPVTNKLEPTVTNKLDNIKLPNFMIISDKILVNFL